MNRYFERVVFTSQNVLDGKCITVVYHDTDDDWQFFSDDDINISSSIAKIASLIEILKIDVTVIDLITQLPIGYRAIRKDRSTDWEINKL